MHISRTCKGGTDMDKNDVAAPRKKANKNSFTVVISLLLSVVLFVVDLYVMINLPGKYSILIMVTIALLVGIFFFINAIMQEINEIKKMSEEQYDNMFKAQKASYLLLKKASEQLKELEEKSKTDSYDEIITAQKAIAKVIISRNKENTDALMNSNDKVLEKVFDFEEKFGTNQDALMERQKNLINDSMKELMEKQQELADSISSMQTSLKNDFVETMHVLNEVQEKQQMPLKESFSNEPVMEESIPEEPIIDSFDLGESESLLDEEPSLDSLDLGESESLLDEEPSLDSLDLGESESLLDEEPSLDSLDLGESESLLDEEPSLDSFDLGESESLLDEEPSLDSFDLGESVSLLDEESSVEESVEEPAVIEPIEEKKEEKPPMPDLSDPNKLMTPDEIAALIANL